MKRCPNCGALMHSPAKGRPARTDEWSKKEIATMLAMLRRGSTYEDVGHAIGRSQRAVALKHWKMRQGKA